MGFLGSPSLHLKAGESERAVAEGRKPDWKVLVSRESGDKNFYTEIGAAWNVAKDGISIQLHALPTDGKLVLFPRED